MLMMQSALPLTPVSPPPAVVAHPSTTPPTTFDPSLYPPLPDSPRHAATTNQSDDANDDLFPSTAHAIERSTNPLLVPLLPSPKVKPTLPHRRPKGWVSTLHGDHGPGESIDPAPESPQASSNPRRATGTARRSSARLPSGPDPLRIGGRTISGVMQYAIRPPSPSLPASPTSPTSPTSPVLPSSSVSDSASQSVDTAPATHKELAGLTFPVALIADAEHAQAQIRAESSTSTGLGDNSAASPAEEPYSLDEIRSSVVGLTDQDNDEVWMSFVRQQLGTLFPDFFQPDHNDVYDDASDPYQTPGRGFGSLPGRGPRALGEEGDQGSQAGWAMVQDGAHHRPTAMPRQGEYRSVPNVREEISGLREEIERLRGVVGGLASGMYESRSMNGVEEGAEDVGAVEVLEEGGEDVGGVRETVENVIGDAAQGDLEAKLDEEEERPDGKMDARREVESEDEVEAEVEVDVRGTLQGTPTTLPPAFMKTAAVSLDLIQTLARATDEASSDSHGQSAEDIFREENLLDLKAHLLSLIRGSRQT